MRVSVVIPTFNRAAFLREALESVSRQTYPNFEVIVVDDGSTDGTREVVAASAARPVYVYQENQGRGAARNAGVGRAQGELIAFLDSDDLWHPDRLARHVEFLARHPDAVFVHGPVDVIDEGGRPDERASREMARRYARARRRGYTYENMLDSCLIFTSTILVRRYLFDEVGVYDTRLMAREDLDWYLRVVQKYRIDFLPGMPLALYRLHAMNAFREIGDKAILEEYREIFSRHLDQMPGNPVSEAVRAQANLSLSFCYAGLGEGRRARQHIRRALALCPRSVLRVDVLKRFVRSFVSSGASGRG
jgi:glycosyltransferase involved in cell wall biosynthesis